MQFTEVKLKLLETTAFADIHQGLANNFYSPKAPVFSDKEKNLAEFLIKEIQKGSVFRKKFEGLPDDFNDEFLDEVVSYIQLNGLSEKLPSKKDFDFLLSTFQNLANQIKFIVDKKLFSAYVLFNSIGLKQLSFFSLDDDLEELMVNSPQNIFVFHKKYGMCRTDLSITEKDLTDIIQKIAVTIGKVLGGKNAVLDARLPDGSRVNATISELSPTGATLTIRKFSVVPLTILDLIENNTISSEAAAFLWLMVDGFGNSPQNMIVAGGTACGKTTFLNVLSNFIRLNERVISIEDTIELSLLARENWVALEARSNPNAEVLMDSLLKNAMRMRPDRLIIGEVRGEEALSLFNAMDTGHQGCLGTIHANNSKEAVMKLQEKPLCVPEAMIPLLDIIVIMQRRYSKERGMQRRVTQIVELSRMDNKVLFGTLFDFDDKNDFLKRTGISGTVLEEIAQKNSISKVAAMNEVFVRKKVLDWMLKEGIRKPLEVLEVIDTYYYNPEKVLKTISDLE
jgi:flagellar protein FlaI